jgi:hypothetical protein
MVTVKSRPKGSGHAALTKMDPFCSEQAQIFLEQKAHQHSNVTSGGYSLYRPLAESFNLSRIPGGTGQNAGEVFPRVHRVIPPLKNWIQGTHFHVSEKHLNRYLAEFCYPFNRRFKDRRVTIFDRLLTACCTTQTVTYRQLLAELNSYLYNSQIPEKRFLPK